MVKMLFVLKLGSDLGTLTRSSHEFFDLRGHQYNGHHCGQTTDRHLILNNMNRLVDGDGSVMKCEIIKGIWYEAERRPSYHVLLDQISRAKCPLGNWVTLDPTDRDADVGTGPRGHHNSNIAVCFIPRLQLTNEAIPGAHVARFFQPKNVPPDHTCASRDVPSPRIHKRVFHDHDMP
jgi:hypothetical protein